MGRGFLLSLLCLFLHLPRVKCNIGCDTSTGLSAGQRPASIQPHRSTSILQQDTLPTFCAQRSRLSFTADHCRGEDNRSNINSNVILYKHPLILQLEAFSAQHLRAKLVIIRTDKHPSVKRLHTAAADCRIYFSLVHNIGLELINLSLLLLDYTCDESGDGLDLLSEGGLLLDGGIYLDQKLQ